MLSYKRRQKIFNLFARTFEIFLYKTLHKLMGLYLETYIGPFTFGMSDERMIN